MLMMILSLITLLITTWIAPAKRLWEISTVKSFAIAILSAFWVFSQTSHQTSNQYLLMDEISTPLLMLTLWLTAPTILASQNSLMKEPVSRQRTYIFMIILLQTMTILAFLANNVLLFFILFESTVIPTLIIITRWGSQKERLLAGTYFLFYTLFGSMFLLTALLCFHQDLYTMSIVFSKEISMKLFSNLYPSLWWLACFSAFLIKLPLYGLHLWLPKAHVEAPVAGSMILAGTLLKLGGYGIIRMTLFMHESTLTLSSPLIIYSLTGVILSAMLCSRQTDMKSLIAFSSVSHMGMVIAALMIKTEWSITGALILMISHGLTSSALFCLANTSYERTHTRTLLLLRGTQMILPLAALWWLLASLMNMALPPSPNFMGELLIFISVFNWSQLTTFLLAMAVMSAMVYVLYLLWSSQRDNLLSHTKNLSPSHSREHLIIALLLLYSSSITLYPNLLP